LDHEFEEKKKITVDVKDNEFDFIVSWGNISKLASLVKCCKKWYN
jgi:hypothetical protein